MCATDAAKLPLAVFLLSLFLLHGNDFFLSRLTIGGWRQRMRSKWQRERGRQGDKRDGIPCTNYTVTTDILHCNERKCMQ